MRITNDQLRKRVLAVQREIDIVIKEDWEKLNARVLRTFPGLSGATRDELLAVVIKGLVYDNFHPGI